MNRPYHFVGAWMLTVALASFFGTLGGYTLGYFLERISHDYPVSIEEYTFWGLRFGLLAGATVSACQIIGHRPPASLVRTWLGLLATGCVTVLIIALGAAGAYFAYRTQLWQPGWELPNPRRYATLLGAKIGQNYGSLIGLLVGGSIVWFRPHNSTHKLHANQG